MATKKLLGVDSNTSNVFLTTVKMIKLLARTTAIITMAGCQIPKGNSNSGTFTPKIVYETPERPQGQSDVIELRTDPLDTVRMAIIGLGMR